MKPPIPEGLHGRACLCLSLLGQIRGGLPKLDPDALQLLHDAVTLKTTDAQETAELAAVNAASAEVVSWGGLWACSAHELILSAARSVLTLAGLEASPGGKAKQGRWPLRECLSHASAKTCPQAVRLLKALEKDRHNELLARLRRELYAAEKLRRQATGGDGSDDEPLTDLQQRVLDIITQSEGGVMGVRICSLTGCEQSSLTKHVIPVLKRRFGVKNRRGAGYYIP